MITVTTPAASTELATLAAVKNDLAITGSADDATLESLIDQASAAITTWCNRVLARETVTETFRLGRKVSSLILTRLPVGTINSVAEGADTLVSTDYEVDSEPGILRRLDAAGGYMDWPGVVIAVGYDAGYLLPRDAGTTLPGDIERAAITLVTRLWHLRGRDTTVKSVSYANKSDIAFGIGGIADSDGLPADIANSLRGHRAVTI